MEISKFKKLIKEAVREVLREELTSMSKSKLQESVNTEESWPSISLTTKNVDPNMRQNLAEKMGLSFPNNTPKGRSNGFEDILAQTAAELRNNPADINNFRNIG